MKIPFIKMHGTGNDFIVVDTYSRADAAAVLATPDQCRSFAARFCDRRFGIGADQVLVLRNSLKADFRMDIFNADGSQVEMCGNGIRCFAKYVWDRGLSEKKVLDIETLAGTIRPERVGDLVRVDMGPPELDARKIPVALDGRVVNHPIELDGKSYRITCVSMGNPHAVIYVDDVDRFPVNEIGPKIEVLPLFPNRINVEFVQILSNREVRMRVWERGSGETLACGTGACATVVAGAARGVNERTATVHLRGGDLRIEWDASDTVFMTGPAAEVFEGLVELDDPNHLG